MREEKKLGSQKIFYIRETNLVFKKKKTLILISIRY